MIWRLMKPNLPWLPLLLVCSTAVAVRTQSAGTESVARLDPALDEVIAADARLDVIRRDYFGAVEGPLWFKADGGGYLLFSDMAANRIYKWDAATQQLSTFLEKSGFSGTDITDVRALDNGRLMVALLG